MRRNLQKHSQGTCAAPRKKGGGGGGGAGGEVLLTTEDSPQSPTHKKICSNESVSPVFHSAPRVAASCSNVEVNGTIDQSNSHQRRVRPLNPVRSSLVYEQTKRREPVDPSEENSGGARSSTHSLLRP